MHIFHIITFYPEKILHFNWFPIHLFLFSSTPMAAIPIPVYMGRKMGIAIGLYFIFAFNCLNIFRGSRFKPVASLIRIYSTFYPAGFLTWLGCRIQVNLFLELVSFYQFHSISHYRNVLHKFATLPEKQKSWGIRGTNCTDAIHLTQLTTEVEVNICQRSLPGVLCWGKSTDDFS